MEKVLEIIEGESVEALGELVSKGSSKVFGAE